MPVVSIRAPDHGRGLCGARYLRVLPSEAVERTLHFVNGSWIDLGAWTLSAKPCGQLFPTRCDPARWWPPRSLNQYTCSRLGGIMKCKWRIQEMEREEHNCQEEQLAAISQHMHSSASET